MYRLVIVDDEKNIAEGIANLFPWNEIGFEVTYFQGAKEALRHISEHKTDVLMSDIEMPDMNGMQLCEQALDVNPEIKIIFISRFSRSSSFVTYPRIGSTSFWRLNRTPSFTWRLKWMARLLI